MRRLFVLAVLALSGCATTEEVWGGRTSVGEVQAVQVETVRWLAANYRPSDFLGDPKAICLVVGEAVGRREVTAAAQSARTTDQDPPQGLLAKLRNVRPSVVPISHCVYGDDLSEVLVDTGERAIVLGISRPTWVTPNLARVSATLRENQQTWYRYGCSVVRGPEGWEVRRCA